MKYFADGVIEDSKKIEALKNSGAFDEPLKISEEPQKRIILSSTAQEANDAKEWLSTTIKEFFDPNTHQHFCDITTDQYAEYKQEAISVVDESNNSLSEEKFKQKWSKIYDITYAGIGESFLTGNQDWGKMEISKCELFSQPEPETFIFETLVSDTMFELTYLVEITVVRTDGGFKIDDIKKKSDRYQQ